MQTKSTQIAVVMRAARQRAGKWEKSREIGKSLCVPEHIPTMSAGKPVRKNCAQVSRQAHAKAQGWELKSG